MDAQTYREYWNRERAEREGATEFNPGPALNPMAFEQAVLAAAQKPPEIRHQLLAFCRKWAPGVSVVRGEADGYDWKTRVLTLAKETAKGEGMRSLLIVAHECGHANQQKQWPWLPAWALKFPIIRLWLEADSWRRAVRMLS